MSLYLLQLQFLILVLVFTQTWEAHRPWWPSSRPEHKGPLLRHQWSSGWQIAETGLNYAPTGPTGGQVHQHPLHRGFGRYCHRWRSQVRISLFITSSCTTFVAIESFIHFVNIVECHLIVIKGSITVLYFYFQGFKSIGHLSVLLQESFLPVWWDSHHYHSPEAAVCLHPVCHAAGSWNGGWEVLQQTHH